MNRLLAIISVEPSGVGDTQNPAQLAGIPVLVLFGDFVEHDSRWATIRRNGIAFAEQ